MPVSKNEPGSLQCRTRTWLKQRLEGVNRFLHACSPAQLTEAIRAIGIRSGDVVMLHSSFGQMRFFEGTALDAIEAMREAVGPQGTLVMPSFPFKHRSYEYLSAHPVFDVRRSPAYTGLLCELFRRRPDAVRSLHPSHPVTAVGPMAEDIACYAGSTTPFDMHSPWHRMSKLNAWIVNVGLRQRELAITQYHYAEEMLQELMPAPLYWPEPFEVTVRDLDGSERTTQAYAHHPQSRKNYRRIIAWHHRTGVLTRSRAGAIELWVCRAGALLDATAELAGRGCTVFSDEGWDALEADETPELVRV